MGLLGDVARSPLLARRILVELRGIRRALERQADVAELQAQVGPRTGQSFRGFSRDRTPSDGAQSSVSYTDPREAERAYALEGDLRALLGRDPTAEELERALAGEIE